MYWKFKSILVAPDIDYIMLWMLEKERLAFLKYLKIKS